MCAAVRFFWRDNEQLDLVKGGLSIAQVWLVR